MNEVVEYTSEKSLGIISLNNGKNNPLDLQMLQSISELIGRSARTDRVLLLRSNGNNFTVGVDIKYIYNTVVQNNNFAEFGELSSAFQNITKMMINHPGVIISVLNGWVVGGGFEISLAADLRIAGDNVKIKLPELSIGTMFSNACTKLLPDLIGLSRAKQLMFLGEEIDAKTALEFGLVNRLYPINELDGKSYELARKLVENTYHKAVSNAKELIYKNHNLDLDTVLDNELVVLNQLGSDPVFLENVRKFVEKQKTSK